MSGKASIIVRTMGRPELSRALTSLAAQTYADLEIILVVAKADCDASQWASVPGIRIIAPGIALDRQNFDDLIWIRDEFLMSAADHGAVVVHGHSISLEPEFLRNRIGIDTGAYRSGKLTAVCLRDGPPYILQS